MRPGHTPARLLNDPALSGWAAGVGGYPAIRSTTASTEARGTDDTILADASSGAGVLTLPHSKACKGMILHVVKTDASANAVTLTPQATDTINGAASLALVARWTGW